MAIEQITPQQRVNDYLDEQLEERQKALMYNLSYLGEQCVNLARSTTKASKNFLDQTGNLRSSIGYVLVLDGKIYETSNFEVVKNGQSGKKEGEAFIKELAQKYRTGAVLILVAGMNYAVHVQNKGYDVLTSGELLAEKLVKDLLKELGLQ